MEKHLIYCIVLLLVVLISASAITFSVYYKRNKYVKNTSLMYNSLLLLNSEQLFHTFPNKTISFSYVCKSKREFDNFTFDKYILYMFETDKDCANTYVEHLVKNIYLFESYKEKIELIKNQYAEYFPNELRFSSETAKRLAEFLQKKVI